jgi:hypothetical protein
VKSPVAVEKGTKAVISANFGVYGERTFNNLQRDFTVEIPPKEFFQQPRLITTIISGSAVTRARFAKEQQSVTEWATSTSRRPA